MFSVIFPQFLFFSSFFHFFLTLDKMPDIGVISQSITSKDRIVLLKEIKNTSTYTACL